MTSKHPTPLTVINLEPHRCSYLPGRDAQHEFLVGRLDSSEYQELMDRGYRRSGLYVYRPVCETCSECRPLRVCAERFVASRSQRRAVRKNADVRVEISPPRISDEKWKLYRRYQSIKHNDRLEASNEVSNFEEFLYSSPINTVEMSYRLGDRLIGVGIVDVCRLSLSSVYFYFDPEEAWRSLGVFSAIREIEECRRLGKPWWYAGFYIRQSSKMNYKSQFRPCEVLVQGQWRSMESASANDPDQHGEQHQDHGQQE